MKFIINTTNMQTGGALQVSLSLLQEWRQYSQHEYHVFLSPQMSALIREQDYPVFFHFYHFDTNPARSLRTALTFGKRLHRLAAMIVPDVVLTVFGPALWTPRSAHIVGFANGYYLFDTSDYIQQRVCKSVYARLKYYLRRFLLLRQLRKEASGYWVETALARDRLLAVWKAPSVPIAVIGNTFGTAFSKAMLPGEPPAVFTLLYMTAYYPHKNLELIPEVIRLLKEEGVQCRFMVTLPEAAFKAVFGAETEYISNAGPQRPDELPAVYAQANAVFIPSLLETFSAAYPEAMKAGKPILTSDLDFARELCGDSAMYFNPGAAAEAAARIRLLMNDVSLQQQLVARGYARLQALETPASRAQKLLALLEAQAGNTINNKNRY